MAMEAPEIPEVLVPVQAPLCTGAQLRPASSNQLELPVIKQATQPVWRMKRRSALDHHSIFVRRLQQHKKAQLQRGQDCADSKQLAALNLQNFTRKLRHAIVSNADVASGWKPAAQALQVKATLDSKLSNKGSQASLAAASTQSFADAEPDLASSMLTEMQQLVDCALREATAPSATRAVNSQGGSAFEQPSALSSNRESTAVAPVANSTAEHVQQASTSARTSQASQTETGPSHVKASAEQKGLAANASSSSIGSKKGKQRPAWVLTAGAAQEAAQAAEQQEEEDLLAFAGGLEFDKYIDEQEDADLKTVLQDIRVGDESRSAADKATLRRHVVRAINNLAGKEVKDTVKAELATDAQSCAQQSESAASTFSKGTMASKAKDASGRAAQLAASQAAAANAAKWDASTKAGSDVGAMGSCDTDSCAELFRENPDMKKMHSLASASALLKKAATCKADAA